MGKPEPLKQAKTKFIGHRTCKFDTIYNYNLRMKSHQKTIDSRRFTTLQIKHHQSWDTREMEQTKVMFD